MAIKNYTGQLRDLGPVQPDKEGVNFVYIDIGDHNLKNVKSSVALGDFLQRGLAMEGETTLWISRRPLLLGVQLPNGKRLHPDLGAQTTLMLFMCLIPIVLLICGTQIRGSYNGADAANFCFVMALVSTLVPYIQWKQVQAIKRIARGELFN